MILKFACFSASFKDYKYAGLAFFLAELSEAVVEEFAPFFALELAL